ncbi:MAG TPA: TlpA disulfide reductase family protein [Accumulibacter sp.]|uniref:TlpA family protein disulfide reductase n=1 Tax=Accumulibacter sp. TaxID=2053492 RepID=UPI0025CB991D|nr:TlpA disulfide reductase family protein [Accumulibacter sp.]MCM8663225.1 TlpA family protein disulfide reductase [Accumulibacter sp.]HNC52751.1 TlpA disulfide reductase family protein [Accumulibacter sp.]
MKRQYALAAAVVAGMATLASIGWLGYRLLERNRLPGGIPPGLISSQQVQPDQTQADAVLRLTLPDLDGRPQALAQWRGKVLVVNYWASWCAPCVEEMPAFSRLQQQYATKGVQFIGIGVDEVENLRKFVRTTPVAYPLLVGDAAGTQAPDLQIKGLPYTLVIDRDGRIAGGRLGRFDEPTLDPILRRLVAQ